MEITPNYEYYYNCRTCGIDALSHMDALQAKLHKRKFKGHEIILNIESEKYENNRNNKRRN